MAADAIADERAVDPLSYHGREMAESFAADAADAYEQAREDAFERHEAAVRDLGIRALAVERLRLEAVRLRKARSAVDCTVEPIEQEKRHARGDYSRYEPCWRRWEVVDGGERTERWPEEDWCDQCRERERVHLLYVAVRQKLNGARGGLTRAASHALRSEP